MRFAPLSGALLDLGRWPPRAGMPADSSNGQQLVQWPATRPMASNSSNSQQLAAIGKAALAAQPEASASQSPRRWARIALCWPRSAAVDDAGYETSRWQNRPGMALTAASGTRWILTRSRSAIGSGCSTSPGAMTTWPTCGCCGPWTGCAACIKSRRTPMTWRLPSPSWAPFTTRCPGWRAACGKSWTRWPRTAWCTGSRTPRGREAWPGTGTGSRSTSSASSATARSRPWRTCSGRGSGTRTCPGWSSPTSSMTSRRSPRRPGPRTRSRFTGGCPGWTRSLTTCLAGRPSST